jgi:hypothetical protein
MREMMDETNAGRGETCAVKVRQKGLQRSLDKALFCRLKSPIEENRPRIGLSGHRNEARDVALSPKKHQPGIFEYRCYIHWPTSLARQFRVS